MVDLEPPKKMKLVGLVNKEVVILKQYQLWLPRANQRQELNDHHRVIKLQFKRSMSAYEVKQCIKTGFHQVSGLSNDWNCTFLETNNGRLMISSNQRPTGDNIIDKRGTLYLCENCDEVHMYVGMNV